MKGLIRILMLSSALRSPLGGWIVPDAPVPPSVRLPVLRRRPKGSHHRR